MNGSQHYRLIQEIAAVSLSPRPVVTQLHAGAVVCLSTHSHPGLAPQMVEIESDGRNYALFAADLADRGELINEDA
jgi:hypothetical protein